MISNINIQSIWNYITHFIKILYYITIVNAILGFDENAVSYTDSNDLHIVNIKKDNITNSLLNTLVEMMKELRDTYDKNIDIKEESHD